MFYHLELNSDGAIIEGELAAMRDQVHMQAGSNNDAPPHIFRQTISEARFDRLDLNGDSANSERDFMVRLFLHNAVLEEDSLERLRQY